MSYDFKNVIIFALFSNKTGFIKIVVGSISDSTLGVVIIIGVPKIWAILFLTIQ